MTLKLTLQSAILLKDLDTFSKMDPYATVELANQKWKTKTHQGGGKQPKWNESHQFDISGQKAQEKIKIKVFDEDVVSDDFAGELQIPVQQLMGNPLHVQHLQCNLKNKNQIIGIVKFDYQYNPILAQNQQSDPNKWTQLLDEGKGGQGGGFIVK